MPWPPSWAKCCLLGRVDEEADLVAADILVLVQAGPGEGEVHVHRDLAGFEGVDAFAHVAFEAPGGVQHS